MKNGHNLPIVMHVDEAKKFVKLSSGEVQVAYMFAIIIIQDIEDPPLQCGSTLKSLGLSIHCANYKNSFTKFSLQLLSCSLNHLHMYNISVRYRRSSPLGSDGFESTA